MAVTSQQMKNITNKNMTEPVEDWEIAADEITESQPVNIPSFLKEDSEYPELSAQATKPKATKPKTTKPKATNAWAPTDKGEWKTDGKKRQPKVKGQKLVLNFKSYADERQERQEERRKGQDNERSKAFEILADKEGLQKRLTKTRMCNSVGTDEPCKHGENCRFAHTLEELVISDCFFGDDCRFIRIRKQRVYNKDGACKCCPHKHPQETIDEFYNRTGLTKYQETTVEEPKEVEMEREQEDREEQERKELKLKAEAEQYDQDRKNGVSWSSKILGSGAAEPTPINRPPTRIELPSKQEVSHEPSTIVEEKVVKDESKKETVLRVPKELAMQAMEMAIKMGSENIRVEII